MNTQLVFKKKAFADAAPTFSGEMIGSREDKVNYVLNTANNCRDWYTPIFANESKYLPVSNPSIVTLVQSAPKDNTALVLNPDGLLPDVHELTTPPQKQTTDLEKGLIIAGVALIIIKLLS